mmetsp:Transcript_26865/g.63979  ORF Transcript_26865/g.63979 Transcript_26865/m.63979 type:complete len:325 (-) Transcript_26865:789-1763(-)
MAKSSSTSPSPSMITVSISCSICFSSGASTRAATRKIRAGSAGAARPSQFAAACSISTVSSMASRQSEGPFDPCRPSMLKVHLVCSSSSSASEKTRAFWATSTAGISEGLLEISARISFCSSSTSPLSLCRSRRFAAARSFGVSASSSLLSSLSSFFPSSFSSSSLASTLRFSLSSIALRVCACCWASPTITAAAAQASAVSRASPARLVKVLAMVLQAKLESSAPATERRVSAKALDCCRSLLDNSAALRPRSEMTSVQRMRSRVAFTVCLVMPSAVLILSSSGTRSEGIFTAHLATLWEAWVTQCVLSSKCVPHLSICDQVL